MCRPSEGNHIGLPLQRTETTHHEDGTMADESITEKIAVYHSALQLQQIPSTVIEAAKLHILDSLGCLLAGSRLEPGRFAYNLAGRDERR